MILLVMFYFVYDEHTKVSEAQTRIDKYAESSHGLEDGLARLEKREVELQEQVERLNEQHLPKEEFDRLSQVPLEEHL